jgi:sulfhydrogenase subunit gamma (sulfur reductase)
MITLLKETLNNESIFMPTPARIVGIEPLTQYEKLFKVELPNGFSLAHRPGQFVELSLLGIGEAPISVCSAPGRSRDSFELCVRAVGKLTEAVHRLPVGGLVGIRGPFGRSFPIERFHGKDVLIVAGGLGLAPLRSLIEEVIDQRGMFGRVIVMFGARTPDDILFADELAYWDSRPDVEVLITVDKPSPTWVGNVGRITSLFPKIEYEGRNMVAAIVGPPVMYRAVIKDLLAHKLTDGNVWLSFERQMKCGVGKCGHCQMHHIYTCQDGPIFSYAEVKHLEEAFA